MSNQKNQIKNQKEKKEILKTLTKNQKKRDSEGSEEKSKQSKKIGSKTKKGVVDEELEDFTSEENSSKDDDIKIRKGNSSKRTTKVQRRRMSQSMSQIEKSLENISVDENGKPSTMEDPNELL